MINILIVEDDIDKISKVISAIRDKFIDFAIETAVDSFSAQKKLSEKKFELLILDLNLPYRKGDLPNIEGGKVLLTEINRSNRVKSPDYIIGLTQFSECSEGFSKIWNVVEYDPTKLSWQEPLIELMSHILKSKKNIASTVTKTETIFVEGETDKKILIDAIKLFYPHVLSKIVIKSCGGAAFVSRDVIIWGKSLYKDSAGLPIKAIALLDGDEAGRDAKTEIERVIPLNSAENKTFRILQLSCKIANHLIPLYSKGVKIPVTFEELFTADYWLYAESNDWLEKRQGIDDLLEDPRAWDKFNVSLKDYISGLDLSEELLRYILKFKKDKKDLFCKYIISLNTAQKYDAYKNIKFLIDEALKTLFSEIPEPDQS